VSDASASLALVTDTDAARAEIGDLAAELEPLGVLPGMIFGHRGLKTAARKLFVFAYDDALVYKLDPATADEVRALPGVTPFQPMPDRPPMGSWLVVPATHQDRWGDLAHRAHAYISALR
jgi:hypothetical protein